MTHVEVSFPREGETVYPAALIVAPMAILNPTSTHSPCGALFERLMTTPSQAISNWCVSADTVGHQAKRGEG